MSNITVIDSIMGSGKTSWIIDRMNSQSVDHLLRDNSTQYLYITPLLDEAERIQQACPDLEFKLPIPKNGRKLLHLTELIEDRENIAGTHRLFLMLNQAIKDELETAKYELIIDEEAEVCREYEIKKDDLRALHDSRMVYVDDVKRLRWNHALWPRYDGEFNEIRNLCDNGNLVQVNDTLLVWEFPVDFLDLFEHVYVLTYLFEGSLMSTYLRANDKTYEMKTLVDSELVDWSERNDREIKADLRELITVVGEARYNDIGKPQKTENPLSSTWYRRDLETGGRKVRELKRLTYNFFNNKVDGKSGECMWTTFNDHKDRLKGKGYTKGSVASNLRATNVHQHRKNLAFLVNVFPRPRLVQYFKESGVDPNQDLYALSQLVQWVWRSRIRRGQPITVWIPSERMRHLFLSWLNEGHGEIKLKAVA